MKLFFKSMLIIAFSTILTASPARSGIHTFTQIDGTKFEGILKGDSSFHWIESDGKVVLYNSKDKFYYYADLNANNELKITNQKPKIKQTRVSQQASAVKIQEKFHEIDNNTKKVLQKMQKESKKGHHPR